MTPRSDPHTEAIREALLQARRIDPRADGRAWEAEPWDAALAALAALESESATNARKVEAYDAARATVKTEGNSRAYYVLCAVAAEARVTQLEEALRSLIGACAPPVEALCLVHADAKWLAPETRDGLFRARDELRKSLGVVADGGGGRCICWSKRERDPECTADPDNCHGVTDE